MEAPLLIPTPGEVGLPVLWPLCAGGEVRVRVLGEVGVDVPARGCDSDSDLVGLTIVVLRPRPALSGALGGGGRFASCSEDAGSVVARQRKHSPVP